jgi:hypothetical protein
MRNRNKLLIGKPEEKEPRPWHGWGVIRTDIRDMAYECVDCISLVQDKDQWRALVSMVISVRFSPKTGNFD